MLFSSMHVYEKRVENVFLGTNSLADSLNRTQSRDIENLSDNSRSRSRIKRRDLLYMDLDELDNAELLSSYELGHINTEHHNKITIRRSKFIFLADPFFQNKLKLFDCNYLSGLFLNIFHVKIC